MTDDAGRTDDEDTGGGAVTRTRPDGGAATAEDDATVGTDGPVARLVVFCKGFFMGMADTVPGVSGGTVALVTGVYERLIRAITAVELGDLRLLVGIHRAEGRAAVRGAFYRVDGPFLLTLFAGIVTAVVTVSRIIEAAIETVPGPTAAFFVGLILASAIVLYREVEVSTPERAAVAVAGIIGAALVAGAPESAIPHSLPAILLSGSVAISAMVLPGVSGAFLLIVLGQYEFMLTRLTGFVDAGIAVALGGENVGAFVTAAVPVVVFLTGAMIGLLSVAHVVRWALARYRGATLTLLVSLMIGGLRAPADEAAGTIDAATPAAIAPLIGAGLLGTLAVLVVDRVTADVNAA
ncbi:DUF368 domain-containing protein [Halobacteriales archaeon SW_7_68_16]|nr:MAG: DUF368 domain-containing protein [Halobacteriales archaeon SW_7_68_16]